VINYIQNDSDNMSREIALLFSGWHSQRILCARCVLYVMLGAVCIYGGWSRGAEMPIVWGKPTNGWKAGILLVDSQNGVECVVYTSFEGTNTTRLAYPGIEEMLVLTMRDSSGKKVEMTRQGRLFGRVLATRVSSQSRARRWVPVRWGHVFAARFTVESLFLADVSGEYELEVQVRLFRDTGTKYMEPFNLPGVKTIVRIKSNN
jgi:hypothetical protein